MSSGESIVKLFSFGFHTAENVEELAHDLLQLKDHHGVSFLITPNSSMILYFNERRNRPLKAFFINARYILADGMPIVWMAKCKRRQLKRLTGSDLFPALWRHIRATHIPTVFVVANEPLAYRLAQENPAARFIIPRMFAATDEEYLEQLATQVSVAIEEVSAEFVFLGLGFPKQEKLGMKIERLAGVKTNRSVLILLLGASFEFYFGQKARAPLWMQRSGLEWLHRFMQEPGRLWKRYTVDIFRFILLALKELISPEK